MKDEDIPLDVKLLKLGLKFCQRMATKECVADLMLDSTESSAPGPGLPYENLTFLHAVTDSDAPKVILKFSNTVCNQILVVDKESFKITEIQSEGEQHENAEIFRNDGLSALDLLSVVVPYTIADAICDLTFHRPHMSDDITAFGQNGADNVMAFLKEELGGQAEKGLPAYKLEDPFIVNLEDMKVTLDFECIIKGYDGKGQDIVHVNKQKEITCIETIRF